MSKKYKKICNYLNYVEHLLILASAVTGCFSISAFASLVAIPLVIMSSSVEIKICAITAGIKRYKSIILQDFIDSYISHVEFLSVNNVLKEYNEMKKKKNPKTSAEYII